MKGYGSKGCQDGLETVEPHPQAKSDREANEERPAAAELGDAIGKPVAEREGFLHELVDVAACTTLDQRVGAAQAAGDLAHHRQCGVGIAAQEAEQLVLADLDELDGSDRLRGGGPRRAVEQAELAEELAVCEGGEHELFVVFGPHRDRDPAFAHQVHRIRDVTLAKHQLLIFAAYHPRQLGEFAQIFTIQRREDRNLVEALHVHHRSSLRVRGAAPPRFQHPPVGRGVTSTGPKSHRRRRVRKLLATLCRVR